MLFFANKGKSVKPYGILEIKNNKGKLIYSYKTRKTKQLFKRDKIEELNSMLRFSVSHGTGKRASLNFTSVAGKTGTTANYKDAWFIGFTDKYVVGVWFGNANYRPTWRLTGGNLPAITWKDFMISAYESDKQ